MDTSKIYRNLGDKEIEKKNNRETVVTSLSTLL